MSELTRVELTWLKNRIENWIRFGRIVEEHKIDRQRRVVSSHQAALLHSSAGRRTITAPLYPASIFCAPSG